MKPFFLLVLIAWQLLAWNCSNGFNVKNTNPNMEQDTTQLLRLTKWYCEKYQNADMINIYLTQHQEIPNAEKDLIRQSVLHFGQNIEASKVLLGGGISNEKKLKRKTILYVESEGWVFTFEKNTLVKYVEQ